MSACKRSAYLNKLGSNIVYVGRSNSKYQCPDSFCAELGSPMRPLDNLEETLRIIKKKFPVIISFSPGDYEPETSSESLNDSIMHSMYKFFQLKNIFNNRRNVFNERRISK